MRDIERSIAEANECAKMMRKNIYFTYQLIGIIPSNTGFNA